MCTVSKTPSRRRLSTCAGASSAACGGGAPDERAHDGLPLAGTRGDPRDDGRGGAPRRSAFLSVVSRTSRSSMPRARDRASRRGAACRPRARSRARGAGSPPSPRGRWCRSRRPREGAAPRPAPAPRRSGCAGRSRTNLLADGAEVGAIVEVGVSITIARGRRRRACSRARARAPPHAR